MTRRFYAAALAAMLALPVLAQPGPRGGRQDRLSFLAGYLSLTDTQKEQAKTIFDAAALASETLLGQASSARDALRAGIKQGKTEAELDQLGAALGVIEGKLAAIDAKAAAKFYALLTAEQKAKYDEMGGRGAGPRGGPMR